MNDLINGIHHITAIASDPQRNLDFYTRVLGLRMIKLTVNFDDPGTYHFYFADETGSPGTVLTFFPFPSTRRGQVGAGQVGVISFAVPEHTLDEWQRRFADLNISTQGIQERFGEQVLPFQDPDGLRLKLVGVPYAGQIPAWEAGPLQVDMAIRGFHGATMFVGDLDGSARLLEQVFGFERLHETGSHLRLNAPHAQLGSLIDLIQTDQAGLGGAGTNHHIAWRTPGDADQLAWQEKLRSLGYHVTPVQDRQYFHSIYFREDSKILYEIATDGPGFTIDESIESLGSQLRLPPWFEADRESIQAQLPVLQLLITVNH